jgi:hypothetical protein
MPVYTVPGQDVCRLYREATKPRIFQVSEKLYAKILQLAEE